MQGIRRVGIGRADHTPTRRTVARTVITITVTLLLPAERPVDRDMPATGDGRGVMPSLANIIGRESIPQNRAATDHSRVFTTAVMVAVKPGVIPAAQAPAAADLISAPGAAEPSENGRGNSAARGLSFTVMGGNLAIFAVNAATATRISHSRPIERTPDFERSHVAKTT